MRRKDREIRDRETILSIIEACDVIRIGINGGDVPYIVPMNFGYEVEGDKLRFYMHSAVEGRKIELLAQDSRVSFEMDADHEFYVFRDNQHATMRYRSVMGTGVISPLPPEKKLFGLQMMLRHYGREDLLPPPEILERVAVLVLEVDSFTGKQFIGRP